MPNGSNDPKNDQKIEKQLISSITYEDLAKNFHSILRRELGGPFRDSHLFLIDPEDSDRYLSLSERTARMEPVTHPSENDLIGKALNRRKPFFLLEALDVYCEKRDLTYPSFLKSPIYMVPIGYGAVPDLLVAVQLRQRLDEEEEKEWNTFFGRVSKILAVVIEKVHLQEFAFQQLNEITTALQLTGPYMSLKSGEAAMNAILDGVTRDLGFDRAVLALVNEETHRLRGALARGYEKTLRQVNFSLDTSQDFVAKAARTGRHQLLRDGSDAAQLPAHAKGAVEPVFNAIALPLKLQQKIIGVLYADHTTDQGQMRKYRLKALEIFAQQSAQALENARLYESVEKLAETDPLTGLFNRYFLDKALQQEIPRVKRYKNPLSMLMIDLADFKKTNDTYGHLIGDEILKAVAAILTDCIRKTDMAVRFGGDEFVVLMPNTTERQALHVQGRIEQSVIQANANETSEARHFQLSIGLRSANAQTVDRILEDADAAMYKKKERKSLKRLLDALVSGNYAEMDPADNLIHGVLKVLEEKEPWFIDHSRRVMSYAVKISQLMSFEEDFIEDVALAALLHDIGKVGLSPELLHKKGELAPREFDLMKSHCSMGQDILDGAEYLREIGKIIRWHHERFDGVTTGVFPGYPDGLKGEEIPLASRILKIADAFECMISRRPYRSIIPTEQAISALVQERGKCFDPVLVDVFVPYISIVTRPLSTLFETNLLSEAV